jgi:hypothetical protein
VCRSHGSVAGNGQVAVIHATHLGLRSATDGPYSFQYVGAVRIALTRAVMGALADIE